MFTGGSHTSDNRLSDVYGNSFVQPYTELISAPIQTFPTQQQPDPLTDTRYLHSPRSRHYAESFSIKKLFTGNLHNQI